MDDSAFLSGGYAPTGSITFTLYNPLDVVVESEIADISGNGTCVTPTGYTPTAAGTYE